MTCWKTTACDDPFLHRFNYENYGGLPVLGVNGNVIIGHGISNEIAIKSMVLATHEVVISKLNDRIREALRVSAFGALIRLQLSWLPTAMECTDEYLGPLVLEHDHSFPASRP
jgi:hypothetical protein